VGGVSAQKQFGDLMETYLANMNLPSREQMVGMTERLQSIEGQLNEIKTLLLQVNNNAGALRGDPAPPKPQRARRGPPAGDAAK
jgi:hypothetical protein